MCHSVTQGPYKNTTGCLSIVAPGFILYDTPVCSCLLSLYPDVIVTQTADVTSDVIGNKELTQ